MQELDKLPETTPKRRVGLSVASSDGPADVEARNSLLYWIGANLAAMAAYYALGCAVGQYFAAYGLFPAPIWLPASVAMVGAVIGGPRLFPGLFLGSFLINYLDFDSPALIAGIISLGNSLGPIFCAALMRYLRPRDGFFNRFSGVVIFVLLAVVLHPALTASVGTFALSLATPYDFNAAYRTWLSWWLCDSGGTLSFAPTLLLWLGAERMPRGARRKFERGDVVVWGAVAVISLVLFALPPLPMTLYTLVPFLLVVPLSWIALRTSLSAAYTLASLVSVIAMAGTAASLGPFHAQNVINPLQLAGLLIVLLTMNVLTIVALFCERRAAEEASLNKTMLLASTSHDLRTPLNAIIGFADMMRQGVWGPIENRHYRDYVENIHASGSLLLGMIRDILDRARIETGKRKIEPRQLSFRPIAESCLDMVTAQAAEKGLVIDLHVEIDAKLYADDLALRQILLNLLSNAVKFTPAGGRVDVQLTTQADGAGLVEVTDSGRGMTQDEQRLAMDPFSQVAARQVQGGAGLGLPNVARLAELHGGKLSISSILDQGTTIAVTFPPAAR
ncbi:ATP-binding protein [Dongia soli]|uniref:histidine kinase n=1 Tax=Dongia soli TaxID=600628 RepID=A0ABU5E691_9PROT|nr:ATP-binding protein [Dongia soli]MDY0881818.1 ATP-binding protein [Dongia soli]